ncbi:MAG: U32 family peptidase [Oscillospiraceae bacterium]|nr:U32 family peptidase [Oscillospiraceae bacterium]
MIVKIPPKRPELLAPAGNFEKLKAAFLFGADAAYMAGKVFGMRAYADNFGLDEIEAASFYAHERKKKLYLTLNASLGVSELEDFKTYLAELKQLKDRPDAAICADLGAVSLVKKMLPELDIHISTQANVQNPEAALAWAALGAKRIILSRELSLGDIRAIKEAVGDAVELECFVHGAMCVAYSGRCLLSNYFTGRDATKGACAQSCRWRYHVSEQTRPGEYLPLEEGESGSLLFSSKDLCMIDHIGDLLGCKIDAFKIEGRMKSAYYAACITNAYRIAIDTFWDFGKIEPELAKKLKEETESVSRREYDTGFFYASPAADAKICDSPGYIREKTYLGTCIGYEAESQTAIFEQKNKVELNQKAQILSPQKTGEDILVSNLSDQDGAPIDSAPHPKMIFGIKLDEAIKSANPAWNGREIRPGDILRSTE